MDSPLSALSTYDYIWRYILSYLPPISLTRPSLRRIILYLRVAEKCARMDVMFLWGLPLKYPLASYDYIQMMETDYDEAVKWLRNRGIPIHHQLKYRALESGHLEEHPDNSPHDTQKYITMPADVYHEFFGDQTTAAQYPQCELSCAAEARRGSVRRLQYLHEHGCPWDSETCTWAAQEGNILCLQYAHENGCPWDEYTNIYAIRHQQYKCIKYLHENGFNWTESDAIFMVQAGNNKCFEYMISHGCPYTTETISEILKNDRLAMMKFLVSLGEPLDDQMREYITRPRATTPPFTYCIADYQRELDECCAGRLDNKLMTRSNIEAPDEDSIDIHDILAKDIQDISSQIDESQSLHRKDRKLEMINVEHLDDDTIPHHFYPSAEMNNRHDYPYYTRHIHYY